MCKEWTVDTYVLYRFADFDDGAIGFIPALDKRRQLLVLDHDGFIEHQYRDCFLRVDPQASKYLNMWFSRIRKRFHCGRLPQDCQAELELLKFHNDDFPFVGACLNSADKRLVAEESDYNGAVKTHLAGKGVTVLNIYEALSLLEGT
jgi:hypothetical protein